MKVILKSNLRIIMAKKEIDSKNDLIKLTKLSKPTIYKIYSGDSKDLKTITFGNLIKVCETLNCTLDELISVQYEKGD